MILGNKFTFLKKKFINDSSFSRRQIHLIVGSIGVICLILAIYPGQSFDSSNSNLSNLNSRDTISFEAAIPALTENTAQQNINENIKAGTNKGVKLSQTNQKNDQTNKTTLANVKTNSPEKNKNSKANESSEKTKNDITPNSKNVAQLTEANKIYEPKNKLDNKKSEDKNAENSLAENNTPNKNDNTISDESAWQTIKIRKNDTLAKIFTRHGFSTQDLNDIVSASKGNTALKSLKPGQTLKVHVHPSSKDIDNLTLDVSEGNQIILSKKETGFEFSQKQLPVEKKIAFSKGEIQASLVVAAKRAGLDNNIVSQMVDIFGSNIDFSSDLRPNDTFRVLFEEKRLNDGERVKTGAILAAEIINDGEKIQAIRYTDKAGHTGYFSPDGNGLTQAFLRSPVNFTSISSGFGKRCHPVYHKMRQHKGVDYAAPKGTPVQAVGDAKVVFVGKKGGYGNVIELAHGARYSTLYAHLSRFAKNIKVGKEIKKGELIGYVGRTGLATGDHLHFEFRIDGIHRDPLTVALPKSKYIPDTHKRHFLAHAKEMLRLMDVHENKISVAAVEFKIQ